MTRYGFRLDSAACSGCKACQVACQDKHDLPAGVLWRRVYEVTGGGWEQRGGAWLNDVFAYNVSMACNHCERPICLEVCPATAIHRRDDGIVLIDADRCMGCRYCEWACPYGALQYDGGAGRMTKCTFCADELDAGREPACVAACPLRVLSIETTEAGDGVGSPARTGAPADVSSSDVPVFPLPDPDLTRPAFRVVPHPRAPVGVGAGRQGGGGRQGGSTSAGHAVDLGARDGADRARVANQEEVAPGRSPGLREPSLVAFTLMAQTAVGMLAALTVARWSGGFGVATNGAGPQMLASLVAIGFLAVGAMAVSFLHLGRPQNARRALSNLRSSWLSREVLFMSLFAGGCVALSGLELFGVGIGGPLAGIEARSDAVSVADGVALATVAAGLALVYAMARVYRLRTVPAWDSGLTTVGFFATTAVLGALGTAWLLALATLLGGGSGASGVGVAVIGVALLVAVLGAIRARTRFYASYARVGV
jgi:anaerobic dimethyl sulfoxide reductase subunit B (iron-sulfur subunit)